LVSWVPHRRVFAAAHRNRLDLLRWLGRRPQVLMAVADYEVALLASARVDGRLEALAGVKAAALIKLRVLPRYRVGVGPSRRLDGRSLQTLSRVPRCATRYQALSRANAGLVRLMAPVGLATPKVGSQRSPVWSGTS
jgi:hypothetical protein